jgi:hypothetical protein
VTKRAENDLDIHYARRISPRLGDAPWQLRVTDLKRKLPPVFVVRQRRVVAADKARNGRAKKKAAAGPNLWGEDDRPQEKVEFADRGLLYGPAQVRCLAVIRTVLARVLDENHAPLELHRFLAGDRIEFRGNLPLDEEAGSKLVLLFKLQERVRDLDRVELIARRVERFTREEAGYCLSRMTNFGPEANSWALAGMKILLGGRSEDKKAIGRVLEQLRLRS